MRLALALLGFVFTAWVALAEETVYSVEVGEPPPPKSFSAEERKIREEMFRAGLLKEVGTHNQPDRPVKLKRLSEADIQRLDVELGGPPANLPLPSDVLSKRPARYPYDLVRAGKSARVVCYFEVLADGSVGRIFAAKVTSEEFLIECARALKEWKFAPAEKSRFLRLPFEANYKKP